MPKTMDELTEFVRATLGAASLGPDAGMGRVRGWDSLGHVNLVLALEQWAGVSVPPERMAELTTLKALASFLRENGALSS